MKPYWYFEKRSRYYFNFAWKYISRGYFQIFFLFNRVKLERPVIFLEYIVRIFPLIILQKQIAVTCIKFAESSTAGWKITENIFFRKYIVIPICASELSAFHIKVQWPETTLILTIIMKILKASKLKIFTKILISIFFY